MKPVSLSSRRPYIRTWWPHSDISQKKSAYAAIGRFLRAKHPEFIENPKWADYQQVLFCKHHGIVGLNSNRSLNEGECPCAETSAPSKTISKNSIHFAVLMENEFISGCTTVRYMSVGLHGKWSGADMLPITTDPAQVSCYNCRAKINAAIKQLEVAQ